MESKGGQPGELFRKVILDQFLKLRDGDRFWFENEKQDFLSHADRAVVKQTTMRDVILRTSPEEFESNLDIPTNVFKWQSGMFKFITLQRSILNYIERVNCAHEYPLPRL